MLPGHGRLVAEVVRFGPHVVTAFFTGSVDERWSMFTNSFQFHTRFDDFRAFTSVLVANTIVAGYLVMSLPFSMVGIVCPSEATSVWL